MRDSVLIITRRTSGEWGEIWEPENGDTCLLYKGDGSLATKKSDAIALCVADGREFLSCAADIVKLINSEIGETVGYIAAHGEENVKTISDLLQIPAEKYSLGDNNRGQGELGILVRILADTIKEETIDHNKFNKSLHALKKAIAGGRLSKSMGSFLTTLAPLSLIKDQAIKDSVCKSLDDLVLDPAIQSDLKTIFIDMGNELHGLADYIEKKNQSKVVEWALQNDSMLKSLARGYL